MILTVSHSTYIPNYLINFKLCFNTRHLVMASNTTNMKFLPLNILRFIIWPIMKKVRHLCDRHLDKKKLMQCFIPLQYNEESIFLSLHRSFLPISLLKVQKEDWMHKTKSEAFRFRIEIQSLLSKQTTARGGQCSAVKHQLH